MGCVTVCELLASSVSKKVSKQSSTMTGLPPNSWDPTSVASSFNRPGEEAEACDAWKLRGAKSSCWTVGSPGLDGEAVEATRLGEPGRPRATRFVSRQSSG